ncbi:protein phosphatase 1 regulatory subunit 12A isoform X7 [Anopheles stephensi]|uniref:protein phosphatase 1 regulatory subunit 12A isoform X7 n=1 Tax=Anopheles stephensi TaxID=30069 RepID=UPI001658AF2E|nr:protein phosphatase 1 regulatory subunit 12A isoform X7 [Anopheles stephensi]
MSLDNRNTSAQFKRAEQLKRWEESEMNKKLSGVPKSPSSRRIKFSSGCIFLAACVAGDKEEVEWLLKNGADIDTANVDGLTALHQACIDDNLDMVEFLVQKGADVNRKDNEGWTPLHATASCGFLSIARYLIENGADLASINSDGELAVDLASSDAMEDLIQHHLDEQGIDCDEARQAEERIMLSDATKWLRTDSSDCDKAHPKTGATAIHVAAAKGYIGVLKLLLEGRGDIDRQDVDGWTPLHAAAYWGQKEATQMLLNASADIDIQNYSGQLAIDIAQDDIVPLLKDARKNVKRTKRRPPSHGNRITDNFETSTETPTKVIRVEMKPIDSNKEKEAGPVAVAHDDDDDDEDVYQAPSNVQEEPEDEEESNEKDEEEEEETVDDTVDEELEEEEEEEEEEEDDDEQEVDEDDEEKEEQVVIIEQKPGPAQDVPDSTGIGLSYQRAATAQTIQSHAESKPNQAEEADSEEEEEEEEENASVSSEPYSSSNPSADSSLTESETDELLPRPVPIISRPAPVPLTTQIVAPKPRVTETVPSATATTTAASNPPPPTAPWRRQRATPTPVPRQFYEDQQQPATVSRAADDVDYANLYYTSKRNQVSEKENKPTEPDVILRRTQSFESDEKFYQRYAELRARIQANSCPHTILPSTPINTKTSTASNNNNNNNSSNTNNNNNNNTTTTTASAPASNISSYLVQRSASLKDHRTLRKTASNLVLGSTTTSPSSATPTTTTTTTTGPASGVPTNTSIVPPATGTTTAVSQATGNTTVSSGAVSSPPTSPSGTPTTTPTAGQIRRSFVPPTRDEESETQRKAHAKRVRETRRSTQGVTLDEIKSAEQLVKKKNASGAGNENDTMASATSASTTTTTSSSPSSLSSSASPSFTTNNATTISGTAAINDRVPSVGDSTDQQQSGGGGNHVSEGSGKDSGSEVAVSASFTIAAPSSALDDGGDGGGGGGHRRHRRSVGAGGGNDEEEDDIKVSYTISAPVRPSSPGRRATVNNSKESTTDPPAAAGSDILGGTDADVPVVSATFHVPAVSEAGVVATTATIRTSGTAAGGVVSSSDSNTTTITNTTSASSNTNHNTAATYTKRSLFDIDNANSLTLAEKLRHEANKYAIAAVADGDLDSHSAVPRVPNSNSTTTNSGGESNSNSTNAPADNSAVSAAAAAAVPPSPTLRKAADSGAASTTTGVTAERRPSWRLKVDGGSKFKLEDASTPNAATQSSSVASGSVYESVPATQATEHGLTTTKLTSSSALAQRRAQQQNGDSTTTTTTTGSSVAGSAIGSRPLSASGLAAGEQYNRVPGSNASSAGEPTTAANSGTDTSPLHHLRRPPKSTTAGEENKENDKENDSRTSSTTAQATQAVIQRRRRQKRRSTGVVSVGIEDLDPDRQDSPVDGEDKETGSERGRSRVGSTASELDTANQPQDSTRENGGDCIDYKALYEQEKADNDKLKMSLRKKDEEVVTLKAALDRFTTATTKNNSLSELEKRERRAMERKMSEMEEELKLLQKYKTENERLRAENRALTRVVSKLTTSAQNQVHAAAANKQ